LIMLGYPSPVIGVSGLNPHNGEGGLIGDEEMLHIGPACEEARAECIRVVGPIPADTVFHDVKKFGLDVVLSMYHDHGNSNIKLLEFGNVANFIGGLPVPVFTVAHGTAFDLAGKGVADAANMRFSLASAARAVRQGTYG
jgi:Pyridoxal phosphate biosynthesis protein